MMFLNQNGSVLWDFLKLFRRVQRMEDIGAWQFEIGECESEFYINEKNSNSEFVLENASTYEAIIKTAKEKEQLSLCNANISIFNNSCKRSLYALSSVIGKKFYSDIWIVSIFSKFLF